MILDKLENAPQYFGISPNLTVALQYLMNNKAVLGEQPLETRKLTDSVQVKFIEYDTFAKTRRWESHIEFTDVQYIISGEERIGYNNIGLMQDGEKQEGKDQIIHQGNGESVLVQEGFFVVLFPQDVHMSKLANGKIETVKKASFKVKL